MWVPVCATPRAFTRWGQCTAVIPFLPCHFGDEKKVVFEATRCPVPLHIAVALVFLARASVRGSSSTAWLLELSLLRVRARLWLETVTQFWRLSAFLAGGCVVHAPASADQALPYFVGRPQRDGGLVWLDGCPQTIVQMAWDVPEHSVVQRRARYELRRLFRSAARPSCLPWWSVSLVEGIASG